MFKFSRTLVSKIKDYCVWLWQQEGTPAQRSRGLACGVFSGCFPLFGLQMFLGVILSRILKGNRLLAISATWISNPVTYLPIYWFNYHIGCLLLGGNHIHQDLPRITFLSLKNISMHFFLRLLLGSIIVGTFSGLIVGVLTYLFLKIKLLRQSDQFF